jgi:hypothetical protein
MEQQIQIKAKDEDLKGVYSNAMQLTHTKEEFVLDFFLTFPPAGTLSSRVILSPGHLKRVLKAIQESVAKYEGQYGKIQEGDIPEQKLGFSN